MCITNNMPVWLFRCNYVDSSRKMPQYEQVATMYEHNYCPITILEEEVWDKSCYYACLKGEKTPIYQAILTDLLSLQMLLKTKMS